ncbi:acetyl-CoA carboxylase biotin carboxyl carrier protein [Pseudomonas sp. LB3P14]
MKLEFIERLIKLAERSGVAELEYSEGSSRVRISLLVGGHESSSPIETPVYTNVALPTSPTKLVSSASHTSGHPVTSSLGGIFYRSPAPDKPAFVQVGDEVKEGQTLAIIEAMKMLNPIEAERGGRISAILHQDGEMVDAGAPLFMLKDED